MATTTICMSYRGSTNPCISGPKTGMHAQIRANVHSKKPCISMQAKNHLNMRCRVTEKTEDLQIRSSIPWRCHPEIGQIREEAHAWLRQYVCDPKLEESDVPLLVLSFLHSAPFPAALGAVMFGLFLVPFDDLMDSFVESNTTQKDTISSQNITPHILSILDGQYTPHHLHHPLVHAFFDWSSLSRPFVTPSQWSLFSQNIASYLHGLHQQSLLQVIPHTPPLQLSHYMRIRRKTIGCTATFPLVAPTVGVEIDETLWSDPTFQRMHNLVADFFIFTNDILSFQQDEGVLWNALSIIRETSGCTMKEAILQSCQRLQAIEDEFKFLLQEFAASHHVQHQPSLHAYLDTLSSHFPAYIKWNGCSPRHRGRHSLVEENNNLILRLNYDL